MAGVLFDAAGDFGVGWAVEDCGVEGAGVGDDPRGDDGDEEGGG